MQRESSHQATSDRAEQTLQMRMVAWLVTGALFMEVLDGNIIATALPQMAISFGTDALRLNVAMSAYLLALGVFIPVSSWIADRVGPRRVFAGAIAGFTLTSLGCGLATDLHLFVTLRVLQGACGALMVPVGRLLVLRNTPPDQRMVAMSNLVWPALVAPVIAPPLGGFITTHATWHLIFFINVPLGLLALLLALKLVPHTPPPPVRSFDWSGFVLSGVGIFSLLNGLDMLASEPDLIGVALLVGGLFFLILALRHFRRVSSPMLDLSPMQIATFRVAILGGTVSRMAIGCLPFLLPLMFQVGLGMSAFQAGSLLLVVFAGNVGLKTVTTPILRRFGYRQVMLVNGALAAASLAACAWIDSDTAIVQTVCILLLCGMTRSMQFTSLGTIAFADVPDRQMGDANALFNVVSQVSMAAGITLGAMAVQFGIVFKAWAGWMVPAAEFKVALLLSALVALLGLIDVLRLPRSAGDHFVGRR